MHIQYDVPYPVGSTAKQAAIVSSVVLDQGELDFFQYTVTADATIDSGTGIRRTITIARQAGFATRFSGTENDSAYLSGLFKERLEAAIGTKIVETITA